MTTLVVSDLHLGARLGRDVLRRREALDALLAALDGVERLVLLGDIVELAEGRPRQAMEVAEPVLRALGARLGARARGDRRARQPRRGARAPVGAGANGAALDVDAAIPLDATPALASMTSWLAPARVRVHYPGCWLSDRVWATHGHYLDRHLLPEAAYGIARGLLGRLPRDGATPADYERAGGPSVTRLEALLTRWLPRPLAELTDDVAELMRAVTMPASRGACSAAGSHRSRSGCSGRRCAGPASPRSRASRTASGSTPTGSSSVTSTAAGRWPATTCAQLARARRVAADRQHRLMGLRAPARPSRRAAAPVLAGRGDPARDGGDPSRSVCSTTSTPRPCTAGRPR